MANTKSAKSLPRSFVSVQSIRSEKALPGKPLLSGRNDGHNIEKMLTMACERFQCTFTVNVVKETKQDYLKIFKQAILKSKRVSLLPAVNVEINAKRSPSTASSSSETSLTDRVPTIEVTTMCDNYNTLTEILLTKLKQVPRTLMKILSLIAPYYSNLARITISKCAINMYTIHELSKIIETSTITEVCLDGSPVTGADYTLILDTTKISYLSLCRCHIQDDACKLLAAKLHYKGSAQNLLLLNLSSNRITDEGAKHIGIALRSNRRLRYLNLTDNHITDCGAGQILDALIEFPLTCEEIMSSRRGLLEYLKLRNDLYEKYLLHNTSFDDFSMVSRKSASPRRKKTSQTNLRNKAAKGRKGANTADDYIKTKTEMLTAEVLGPFEDPFQYDSVKRIEGHVYSIGNMSLAYLNLAYNNLTYMSVKKLENVIKYQSNYKTKSGLINVVIEGNNLPISCPEFTTLDKILAMKSVKK